ncbi:MAG: hypothetical protein ACREL6_12410, partial [Gemmatimonadales bacterium]
GYDYVAPLQFHSLRDSIPVAPGILIDYDSAGLALRIHRDRGIALTLPLDSMITVMQEGSDSGVVMVAREGAGLAAELRPTNLQANTEGVRPVLTWLSGWILIRLE